LSFKHLINILDNNELYYSPKH